MISLWSVLLVVFIAHNGTSKIIRSLNATEYDLMPPLFAVDNYDWCLGSGGTYCTVKLDLFANPDNDLFKQIQGYSALTSKHFDYKYIDRGVCVNITCQKFFKEEINTNKVDLYTVLERCMNDSIWKGYRLQANLSYVYSCDQNKERLHTNVLDWIVLAMYMTLLVFNVIGSVYDAIIVKIPEKKNENNGNKYLLSFSIFKNWQSMVTTKHDDLKLVEDMKTFNGMKAVTTLLVILVHSIFLIATGFSENTHDYEKAYDFAPYKTVFYGACIVHVFFVISGYLLVHTLQTTGAKDLSWISIPKIVCHRWCRFTPPYAMLLAFNVTWLRHLGSGPLWGRFVTSTVVSDCRKYWWLHLLYINNYQPYDKYCAIQTWHIAADMQLFIIGLLIYIATQKTGSKLVLFLSFLVGIVAPALHVWMQHLDGVVLFTPETFRSLNNPTFGLMHIRGYNNLAGYVVGMVVAYIIRGMQNKNVNLRSYKILGYASWFIIPVFVGLFYAGHLLDDGDDGVQPSLGVRMAFAASHQALVATIVGFAITAIFMKCSVYLRVVFGWRGWEVPNKLSYAVYLLHMDIIYITLGSKRQLAEVSLYYLIVNYCGIVMVTYLVSVPFYLLVEAPMSQLIKIGFNGTSTRNNKKNS